MTKITNNTTEFSHVIEKGERNAYKFIKNIPRCRVQSKNSRWSYFRLRDNRNNKTLNNAGYKVLKPSKIDSGYTQNIEFLDFECYINEETKQFEAYAIGYTETESTKRLDQKSRKVDINELINEYWGNYDNEINIYKLKEQIEQKHLKLKKDDEDDEDEENNEKYDYTLRYRHLEVKPENKKEEDWLAEIIYNIFIQGNVNNKTFYMHNGSGFDMHILMRGFMAINKKYNKNIIKNIVKKGNKILTIKTRFIETTITWKCSYLLLPMSLKKLSKSFDLACQKYEIEHNEITKENYMKKWSSIRKYLLNDINVLENLVLLYQKNIYKEFQIDCLKSLTFSSLSYRIFKAVYYLREGKNQPLLDEDTNFLKYQQSKIISPLRLAHEFIQKSYKGGINQVYKPYAKKAYFYDINSSYPSVMRHLLPSGTPSIYDIRKGLKNLFGFAYARVSCPKDVEPFLSTKDKKGSTIYPIDTFTCYFFSEELKYAKKLGYKIELIEAIEFKKGKPLKSFVLDLYAKKELAVKEGNVVQKQIVKLLLNSLYGRMGLRPITNNNWIISIEDSDEIIKQMKTLYEDVEVIELSNDHIEIRYEKAPNTDGCLSEEQFTTLYNDFYDEYDDNDNAISLASAISSYGRIKLRSLMDSIGIDNIIYFDTDSLITTKPLDKAFLHKTKLGFLSPVEADDKWTTKNDKEYLIENIHILGQKIYSYEANAKKIIKFKGLTLNDNKNDIINQMDKYIKGKIGKISTKANHIITDNKYNIYCYQSDEEHIPDIRDREKIFDNKGKWIDTKPIDYAEKYNKPDVCMLTDHTDEEYKQTIFDTNYRDKSNELIKTSEEMDLLNDITNNKGKRIKKFINNSCNRYLSVQLKVNIIVDLNIKTRVKDKLQARYLTKSLGKVIHIQPRKIYKSISDRIIHLLTDPNDYWSFYKSTRVRLQFIIFKKQSILKDPKNLLLIK